MASPIEVVVINLQKIGAYQFLFPFILTAAVFYGLLRRSKLFGEPETNITINGVIALVAAFMVWSYPILNGVSVEENLSAFFFGGTISTLTVMIGLLIASMILPKGFGESLESLEAKTKSRIVVAFIIVGLLIALGILFSSGFLGILGMTGGEIDMDFVYSIVTLVIILGFIAAVVWFTGK